MQGYVNAMQNATENSLMCLLKEKGKLGTLESYGMHEAWVVVLQRARIKDVERGKSLVSSLYVLDGRPV
jgi:hypothetical protein